MQKESKHSRIEQVVNEWNSGKSLEQISIKLGLKEHTIQQYLSRARSNGMQVRQETRNKNRIEQVVKEWNSGKSLEEISKELGISRITARNYLTKARSNGMQVRRVRRKLIKNEQVVKEWNSGKSIEEISQELGITRIDIKKHLSRARSNGIEVRKEDRKKTKEEQVVGAWNSGKSLEEISKELGISKITARNYLSRARSNGIKVRKARTRVEQVAEEWNSGKGLEEISKELGITKITIKKYLTKARSNGIKVRKARTRVEQVAEEWNSDKSLEEISKELGISKLTAKNYLIKARSNGIKVRKARTRVEQVAEEWNSGKGLEEISKELGISKLTARNYLTIARSNGIEVRKNKTQVHSDTIEGSIKKGIELEILEKLKSQLPRKCAQALKIEPRVVYDLLEELSIQEKNSLKKSFIQNRKNIYNEVVKLMKRGMSSGKALLQLENTLGPIMKPDLADIYFVLGNGTRALKVLNEVIYSENKETTYNIERAKEKKDEIELELKSMEIRRVYKTEKNMDGSTISYDDLCRRYKVRTSFLVQILGREERDY